MEMIFKMPKKIRLGKVPRFIFMNKFNSTWPTFNFIKVTLPNSLQNIF